MEILASKDSEDEDEDSDEDGDDFASYANKKKSAAVQRVEAPMGMVSGLLPALFAGRHSVH